MKRLRGPVLSAIMILAVSVRPVFAAPGRAVAAQGTVTASAVVVPAQVSELAFLISGMARDIPVKEGDSVKAGQTLLVLDAPELEFAVREAEAGLREAQAQAEIRSSESILKYKINFKTFVVKRFRVSVPHEVIEIANAAIREAQASVDIAQANLAEATLLAPYDGTIAAIKVIPGEYVPADQAVVTLASLATLQIETTDLSERDIAHVHVGDPVEVFVEALGKHFPGKVSAISPMATVVGGDVVFKVTIVPDTQPEGLRWGMTAEVNIQSGE